MSALASIRIQNYRCFSDHTVDLGRASVVVGKNNAGKSTLIEAIRLVAIALRRFQNPVATQAPRWLDDYAPGNGQRIELSRLGVWPSTLFHRYGEPPAIIEAGFLDGSRLVLFVGPEGIAHTVFFGSQGRAIRCRRDIGHVTLPRISILPQIVPLEREEKVLVSDYVRQNLDSNLASRHFRNQLIYLRSEHFDEFTEVVESSWPGVRVQSLETVSGESGDLIQLMIRDGSFVAEAAWMGHGLQMWLQTLWFVVRSQAVSTIVLDEPDVYMHPDLQRKLVRMLRSRSAEMLIATHSTEILAEVDPENVLVLDRELPRSSYSTDLPSLQRVVEGIGSAQNLQIARLWRSRALILVEGDDMRVLKRVHDLICPPSSPSLDSIPNWPIGGWGGWSSAIGAVSALQNSVHESIRCYCVLDSDYHLPKEIADRKASARSRGIELHIHSVKEIENFLLVPSLIRRAIERSITPPNVAPSETEISNQISIIAQELLPVAQDLYVSEFLNANRGAGAAFASRQARELVESRMLQPRGILGIVSGKDVLSKLSCWTSSNFGVSFGANSLIRLLRRDEVDRELADLVMAIAEGRAFA
jgi:hypothetical protein